MSGGKNGKPVEIALVGSLPASLVGALESRFTVHHIHQETDPLAKLQEIGPQIRGAVSHGMAGLTKPYIELMQDHRAITRLVVARKYEEAELRVGKHVYNGYRTFVATLKAEDSVGPSPAISNFRR